MCAVNQLCFAGNWKNYSAPTCLPAAGPVATITLPHMLPLGLHGSWTGSYLGPQSEVSRGVLCSFVAAQSSAHSACLTDRWPLLLGLLQEWQPTEYDIRRGVSLEKAA
jgi:hypothetical protein